MVPKYGGRDCELSTTGIGQDDRSIDSWTVTRETLRQVAAALAWRDVAVWSRDTQPRHGRGGDWGSAYSMDCLRNWTGTGQCYYADMGHFEAATATCLYPTTFAAQCLSTLLVAEDARRLAEGESDEGNTYALTTSNADLLDPAISFGTHLNVQIASSLWEDLMVDHHHPAILGFVTSAIAAAIPFFGAGYLLPMRDGTTIYSLSGRATTSRR